MDETFQVKMRDGILLATQVQTPESGRPWPVVIARTPYSKAGMARWLGAMAKLGYAVVTQDVRGTGESEGTFDFLRQEPEDAADTGRWVLEQPFCDGSLGLVGLSYLGASCLGIATGFPDNVRAAVWVAPVLGGNSVFRVNGALRLHHNLPWMGLSNPRFREVDWASLYRRLPLKDALASVGIASPLWDSICADLKQVWTDNDLTGAFKAVDVPGMHFAGFWDFMLDAALSSYVSHAGPDRKPQALFAGPWSHNGIASEVTKTEHRDYGPPASSRFMERITRWFDHHLKGRELTEDLSHGASAYVAGVGWVRSPVWPPAEAKPYDLFLGAGTLEEEPGAGGSLSYTYDPTDPVPTEGGALWEFPRAGLVPGPALVTTGDRKDVLVFQSKELSRPVTALGSAEVVLHVGSDPLPRISLSNWSTWNPAAQPGSWRTPSTALKREKRRSPSTSRQSATSSRRATGSAWTSPAPTSPSSIGT